MSQIVNIYCDGACRGNGNKTNIGGWGVLVTLGTAEKLMSGVAKNTTNNIMELTACIKALEGFTVFDKEMVLTSDSKYVVDGLNNWSKTWIGNGWRDSKRRVVKNKELWQQLLSLISMFPKLTIVHCKGHADNPGNIRADELANQAMDAQ